MHRLAPRMETLADTRGVTFRYDTRARRIELQAGRVTGVAARRRHAPSRGTACVFNGDPRALAHRPSGRRRPARAVPQRRSTRAACRPRSGPLPPRPRGPDLHPSQRLLQPRPRRRVRPHRRRPPAGRPHALRLRAGPRDGTEPAGTRAVRDHHERPARSATRPDRRTSTHAGHAPSATLASHRPDLRAGAARTRADDAAAASTRSFPGASDRSTGGARTGLTAAFAAAHGADGGAGALSGGRRGASGGGGADGDALRAGTRPRRS